MNATGVLQAPWGATAATGRGISMKLFSRFFRYIYDKSINVSIKNKVKYVLLSVCTLISLLFVAVNYRLTGSWLEELVLVNYHEIATKQFEFIEYWMERRAEHVEKLSRAPLIVNAANIISSGRDVGGAAQGVLKKYIDDVMYDQGSYSWITLIDSNGKIIVSSDNRSGMLDADLFSQIPARQDIHIFRTFIDNSKGSNTIIQPVSFPVYSENKKPAGYIICAVNMNVMDDSLNIINLGENGSAFIIDGTGRVICSSREYEFQKTSGVLNDYYIANSELQQEGFWLINHESRQLVKSVAKCLGTGHAGHEFYVNHEGREVIGIWKWLSYFQWMFLVEVDKSEAFAAITKTVIVYLVIGVVFIGISIIIALGLSRNINRSISAFMESFGRGALGDLSVRYPVSEKSGRTVFQKEGDSYIEYDKGKGFCFFEIGSISRRIGKEVKCRFIIEKKYKSCVQCSVYRENTASEMHSLGVWFNLFMSKINEVVKNTLALSHELYLSSDEMSKAIGDFSENANTQASSTEEIIATVEVLSSGFTVISDRVEEENLSLKAMMLRVNELTEIIDNMGDKIRKTQVNTDDFTAKARHGEQLLGDMNSSMEKISESSAEAVNIIQIIDDISEKINLLSLNASIEAARAGEHGKGFAVVAQEISKLADQTAASLKQIDQLIKVNNSEVKKGLANVQGTVDTITAIIEGFNLISRMMKEISDIMENELDTKSTVVDEIESIKERSDAIKQATHQQMDASDEIVKMVGIINDTTQLIAARSEELAANSQNMRNEAELLNLSINYFKSSEPEERTN
ncbi:MAG TPA: methyl-accepting chemotaxis protein [Spirochaetota bacterium]|nr:methyl-accepting chemotaxis protein [Spirochaetota bacterium]